MVKDLVLREDQSERTRRDDLWTNRPTHSARWYGVNDEEHTLATWVVEERDGRVSLRWRANASATAWMDCGGGPPAILDSLIEWVFSEATPEDLIITPRGSFTKQRTPAGKAVRA